jgi:hypothetical protein
MLHVNYGDYTEGILYTEVIVCPPIFSDMYVFYYHKM